MGLFSVEFVRLLRKIRSPLIEAASHELSNQEIPHSRNIDIHQPHQEPAIMSFEESYSSELSRSDPSPRSSPIPLSSHSCLLLQNHPRSHQRAISTSHRTRPTANSTFSNRSTRWRAPLNHRRPAAPCRLEGDIVPRLLDREHQQARVRRRCSAPSVYFSLLAK